MDRFLGQALLEAADGEAEHQGAEGDHQQALGPQLGQAGSLEVEATQEGHEVSGRDEVGHHLEGLRHVPDVEHEAREQEGGQEGGHEGELAGQELALGLVLMRMPRERAPTR